MDLNRQPKRAAVYNKDGTINFLETKAVFEGSALHPDDIEEMEMDKRMAHYLNDKYSPEDEFWTDSCWGTDWNSDPFKHR